MILRLLAPKSVETQLRTIPPILIGMSAIWFAVPKSKISRQKKRTKSTLRDRIPLRKDIIVDPRTGETTRSHRLPFNWEEYLPEQPK